jgi:hypothetical protein
MAFKTQATDRRRNSPAAYPLQGFWSSMVDRGSYQALIVSRALRWSQRPKSIAGAKIVVRKKWLPGDPNLIGYSRRR